MRLLPRGLGLVLLVAALSPGLPAARAQEYGEAVASGGDPEWPRVIEEGGTIFTVYQPQIDKFEDAVLEARAAVKVDTKVGDKTQTSYGVVWITARAADTASPPPFISTRSKNGQFGT